MIHLSAEATESEREPVRFGVLGCADVARRRLLPALRADPGTRITALASRSRETAEAWAREYGCAAEYGASGYAALLARTDVDAVYVPLPAALHGRWAEAALRSGKHVLCEKPLTTDGRSTAALVELAAARGLVLAENVMFVHHPQHEVVRGLVADGAIGEPRLLNAAFEIPALPEEDIRHRRELGGGALFDVGLYPVRAALHLVPGPLSVVDAELTERPGREVETGGWALLRNPAGVTARLAFGLEHSYRCRYELHGSEGSIVVDRAFTPPADHRPRLRLYRADGSTGPRGRVLELPAHDQVARTLAAFTAAVRAEGGAPAPDRVLLEEAALLEDIRRKAARPSYGHAAAPAPLPAASVSVPVSAGSPE
ncbi:Gfo/Idh/MocA family protein [Streptomyces sp. AS13]|uniref:Gfo/Idh/MocA family protein n=1 Tax=Streptomyces sp. AS13 TaxID=3038080 RepID=UPI00278C3903|nr:Gfo/Idh/MocA family oxidoreductase [Streptomyces sp. AS13]